MITERPFLFVHMLQVSKWSLRNLILYTFSVILYIYIATGQGHTTPWGQIFYVNRKPLSLCPFVASLKKKSDFIHFFNNFIYTYSPGQGQKNPCGQTFDVNRKPLSLCPFVAGWTKSWCQKKSLVTKPICCKFKKISLKSEFIHNFSCFYTCI